MYSAFCVISTTIICFFARKILSRTWPGADYSTLTVWKKCKPFKTFQTGSRGSSFTQQEIYRKVSLIAIPRTFGVKGRRSTAAQATVQTTTLQHIGHNKKFQCTTRQTSREERLAKAEAPSEASLLLASRRE